MPRDASKKLFQIHGLILSKGESGIIAGVGSPETEWINVPLTWRYLRSNGEIWRKTGSGDLLGDWTLDFDPSAAPGATKELFEDPIYWTLGRWLGGGTG